MSDAASDSTPGTVETTPVATVSTPTSAESHRPAPPNTATSAWLTAANAMPPRYAERREHRPVGPVVGRGELHDAGDEQTLRGAERGGGREPAQGEQGRRGARGQCAPRRRLQRDEGGEAAEPQREHREQRDGGCAEERRADAVGRDRVGDDRGEARRLVVGVGRARRSDA